jgi:hypothetical protein
MNANMNKNILPEMVFEILKYLHSTDIVSYIKVFNIPKNIINQPVFMDNYTVLECALMLDTYCEDINLIKRVVKNGGNALVKNECGTTPFSVLLCHYQLNFISEDKFHEIYNILFPGDLSFTRSGKCYSGIYHTIMFKN